MLDWMLNVPRGALWAGMGIGKSSAALMAVDVLRLLGEIGSEPGLVLGPMRVARDTWPEEVAKWDNFKHMRIVPLTGCSPRERARRLQTRGVDLFTINYELIEWLVDHYMARWPFRIVIADEADRLKGLREKKGGIKLEGNKKGKSATRAFQLARVAHNMVRRWVNLTGTPCPAGLRDLWGQTWYLDRGARLGRTHGDFMRRWFRKKFDGYGIEPLPYAHEQIHRELRDICLTVDPKDYFDLHEPICRRIEIELPKKVRAMYKDMEDDSYLELEELGVAINAMNSAAVLTKLLQLANGAVYTQRPEWAPIHDLKLEALESIVHEAAGMPILCAYAFQSDKTRILRAFPGACDISTPGGMRDFRSGAKTIGVAHPRSMGHGIDGLQHITNIIAFFGHDWKTGERVQMIERIGPMRQFQAGYDRPCFVYDIVARRTEDENVLDVHAGNLSVMDVVMRAMKRRHGETA